MEEEKEEEIVFRTGRFEGVAVRLVVWGRVQLVPLRKPKSLGSNWWH